MCWQEGYLAVFTKHIFRAKFCVKTGSGSGVAFEQDFKSELSQLVMVMLIPVSELNTKERGRK